MNLTCASLMYWCLCCAASLRCPFPCCKHCSSFQLSYSVWDFTCVEISMEILRSHVISHTEWLSWWCFFLWNETDGSCSKHGTRRASCRRNWDSPLQYIPLDVAPWHRCDSGCRRLARFHEASEHVTFLLQWLHVRVCIAAFLLSPRCIL